MRKQEVAIFFIKETLTKYFKDKIPKLAAALSFYTVFAAAPLLIFVIAVVGLVLDKSVAEGRILNQVQNLLGTQGASMLEGMVMSASKPSSGILASAMGFAVLLFAATGAFVELKDSLNIIWDVPLRKVPTGLLAFIKERVLSLAMIMGVGFMLLVSLVVSTVMTAFSELINFYFPYLHYFFEVTNFILSFGIILLLFAMMFKYLPDIKVKWRDLWFGSSITALLFVLGKSLIGFYLGRGAFINIYGAAGSLAVLFLWVYYSAQIFFLGAEITVVYSKRQQIGS